MKGAFTPWLAFVLMLVGALAMAALPPALEAIASPGVPLLWWADRAFGLLAYLALWLSTFFGVLVGSRGAGGLLAPATMTALHRRWATAAIATLAVHIVLVVGDRVSGVSVLGALIPLASGRLTGPVALGTLATWGLLLLIASSAMPSLPRWVWRASHATAFGTWVLALVHGLTAGTDASSPVVQAIYLGTGAALVGALVQRVLLAMHDKARPARAERAARGQANPTDSQPTELTP